MPAQTVHPVAVFPAQRYGLIQPWGDVDGDSVVRSAHALLDLPGWEPGFDEVWDLRHVGAFDMRPSDVPRLLELEVETRDRLGGARTVFVTDDRPVIALAVRFYGRLVRPLGRSVVVCRTEEDVVRYLSADSVPLLGPNRAA